MKFKSKNYKDGWSENVNLDCTDPVSGDVVSFPDITLKLYADSCDPGFEALASFENNAKTLEMFADGAGQLTFNVFTDVMTNLVAGDGSCTPQCVLMDSTCSSELDPANWAHSFDGSAFTFTPYAGRSDDIICVKCHQETGGKQRTSF